MCFWDTVKLTFPEKRKQTRKYHCTNGTWNETVPKIPRDTKSIGGIKNNFSVMAATKVLFFIAFEAYYNDPFPSSGQ